MFEAAIFAICGLMAIAATLIRILSDDQPADQIAADYWWLQLPM